VVDCARAEYEPDEVPFILEVLAQRAEEACISWRELEYDAHSNEVGHLLHPDLRHTPPEGEVIATLFLILGGEALERQRAALRESRSAGGDTAAVDGYRKTS
jgi:hypothetical protein